MKRIYHPLLLSSILVLVIVLSVLHQVVSSRAAAPATPSFSPNYMLQGGTGGVPSLVGEWRFDEANGTSAADSSGRALHSTLQNGPVWTSGRYRAGLRFDGVNDYVQVGAPAALVMTNTMSLSAWIYPTGVGTGGLGIIVCKEGEYEIARFDDGTIRWAVANTAPGWNFMNTGFVAPLNQWTHLTLTYNNGQVKTYANGNLVHTYLGNGAIGDVATTMNDFRIGGRQAVAQHFMGLIDEVSVYNQALAVADVQKLSQGSMPRNLALGKPATQSSTGWDSPASLAVDGNTDGDWYHGSVTHTNDNFQAWWQVDLGSVQQIENVSVWMMTICCSSHDNFDVKLSSDGSNWTSHYVAGPIDQVTVPANGAARYVRVQLRGGGYLALAEVQVWGVPGVVMPGVIQAEDFDNGGEGISYHDLSPANEGGQYRTTAVDISTCSANNYVIGWNGSGEWTQYSINVPTSGNYTFQAVIGEESATGSLHVDIDGVNRTGPVTIPATGGWCTLQTISKSGIFLSPGQHMLRVVTDNVGVVLDSFRLVAESSPNAAAFVSQSVPASMVAGQLYNVSVTMLNTGTNTWTASAPYYLGTQNPQDNSTWSVIRVMLPNSQSIAPGQQVTFAFPIRAPGTAGTYNFQMRMVQDNVEWFGAPTPNVAVTVTAPNQPPNAKAGGPYSVTTGTPVQFSGAASSDPDGSISTYAWNFGDGQSGTGVSPSHAYAASGVYTVTLTVTDNAGGSGSTTASVTVVPPPVAPSALTATAPSANQINLSWNDNSSNETAFQIERATQAGGPYATVATVAPNSKAWSNTGLSAGVTYFYRLRSAITAGYSAYSNVASATTIAAPAADARYSLSLNGVNSYVVVPNSSTLNISGRITVEAWIKTNTTASQGIVERYNWLSTDDGGYALRLEQGRLQFYTIRNSNSYDFVQGGTPVSVGVWHHVAGVFDGTQLRVYLDGREDGVKASTVAPAPGTQSLKIGARGNDAANCFNGLIDEVRVSSGVQYRGNFTAMSHHDTGDVITDGGQRGLWAFDTATANDDTGNGNNGTLVGDALITTVTMGQNLKYENLMASSSALADRQVLISFDEFFVLNKKISNQYPDAKFAWVPSPIHEGPPYFMFATNWGPNHGETTPRLTRITDLGISLTQTVLQGRYENFLVDFPVPASNISFEGIGVDNFNTLLSPCAASAWVNVYFTTNFDTEQPWIIPLCSRKFGVDPPNKPFLWELNKHGVRNATRLVFHSILDNPGGLDFDNFKFTVPVPTVTIADDKPDTNNRVPGNLADKVQQSLIGGRIFLRANGTTSGSKYHWDFTGPVAFVDGRDSRSVSFETNDGNDESDPKKTVYTVTAKVTFTNDAGQKAESTVTINVRVPTLPDYRGTPGASTVEVDKSTVERNTFIIWQMGSSDPEHRQPAMTFNARAQIPDGPYLSLLQHSGITFQQAINVHRKVRNLWGKESCKTTRSPQITAENVISSGWRHDGNLFVDRVNNFPGATKNFSQSAAVANIPNARSLSIDFKEGVEGIRFHNIHPENNNILAEFHDDLGTNLIDVDAALVDDRFETSVMYSAGSFSRPLGTIKWQWGGEMVFDTTRQGFPYSLIPAVGPDADNPVSRYYVFNTNTTMVDPQKDVSKTFLGTATINSSEMRWGECPEGFGKPQPTGIARDFHTIIENRHGFVQLLYKEALGRSPFARDIFSLSGPSDDRIGYHFWASKMTKNGFKDDVIDGERVHTAMAFLFAQDLADRYRDDENLQGLSAQHHTPEFNKAFVWACYKVFLQRNPGEPGPFTLPHIDALADMQGYNFWVGHLTFLEAQAVSDDYPYFETAHAFLESIEYKARIRANFFNFMDDISDQFDSPIPDFAPPPQ